MSACVLHCFDVEEYVYGRCVVRVINMDVSSSSTTRTFLFFAFFATLFFSTFDDLNVALMRLSVHVLFARRTSNETTPMLLLFFGGF